MHTGTFNSKKTCFNLLISALTDLRKVRAPRSPLDDYTAPKISGKNVTIFQVRLPRHCTGKKAKKSIL